MIDRCDPPAVVVALAESTEGNQNAGGGAPESNLDAAKYRGGRFHSSTTSALG